ncbi:MAG: hypothetical protein L0216_03220 [Planctomycetales bacterium]|nr:hypothetical protein [Planctomycetales bacterium]
MTRGILVLGASVLAALAAVASADETAERLFHEALFKENALGELSEAVRVYREVLSRGGERGPLAAKTWNRIGRCLEKMGRKADARAAYEWAAGAVPEGDPLGRLARAAIRALESRGAPSEAPGAGARGEREALEDSRAELEREIALRRGVIEELGKKKAELEARIAELSKAAGEDPARARLRALEAVPTLARDQVPMLLRAAAEGLAAGSDSAALDSALKAQWLCGELARVGERRPDWEERAREIAGAARLRQQERERATRAASPPPPVDLRATLLAAPPAFLAGLASGAGVALRALGPPEGDPSASTGVTALLDPAQALALGESPRTRAIPGGERRLRGPQGEASALTGEERGPAVQLKVRAVPAGAALLLTFEVAAWTGTEQVEDVPGSSGPVPLERRGVERLAGTQALARGATFLVAGLRSPFPARRGEVEDLIVLLEWPRESK